MEAARRRSPIDTGERALQAGETDREVVIGPSTQAVRRRQWQSDVQWPVDRGLQFRDLRCAGERSQLPAPGPGDLAEPAIELPPRGGLKLRVGLGTVPLDQRQSYVGVTNDPDRFRETLEDPVGSHLLVRPSPGDDVRPEARIDPKPTKLAVPFVEVVGSRCPGGKAIGHLSDDGASANESRPQSFRRRMATPAGCGQIAASRRGRQRRPSG